ncbi:maltodextrin utilization protein YvdJ [Paenibacillus sp. DS2015]|uniref:YxlC family protein n=1 Tax=Paenibacillus sp. DS2015 TaxID=3373917 RepID=UPI003D1EC6D8
MGWNDEKVTEEETFLIGIRQSLDRMDHVLDQPSIPSKEHLKDHIHVIWKERRKSMMLELLLFWLVSLFVIGSGTLLVYSAPWSLWVIQGISFVVASVIVIRYAIQRRKEGIA